MPMEYEGFPSSIPGSNHPLWYIPIQPSNYSLRIKNDLAFSRSDIYNISGSCFLLISYINNFINIIMSMLNNLRSLGLVQCTFLIYLTKEITYHINCILGRVLHFVISSTC